jgi:dCTP deaminase
MAILTHDEIIGRIRDNIIKIEPFDESRVGPASVDMILGSTFRVFHDVHQTVELNSDNFNVNEISRDETVQDKIILQSGQTVLGITVEKLTLPDNICGWIQGRSRFARVGLMVHISSNFIQPGVSNKQVLELYNAGPMSIALHPGIAICQVIFEETTGHASYNGRFQNQDKP